MLQRPASRLATHLVSENGRVCVVPVLDLDAARHLVDAEALQPVDGQGRGQGRGQEAGRDPSLVEVLGDALLALPLERVLADVLADPGAGDLLEAAMRLGVVRRREAAQVRRL